MLRGLLLFTLAALAVLVLILALDGGRQAPDPGGNEEARLSGPPAGKRFGFNDTFHLNQVDSEVEAQQIRAAGGNAARMPISWAGLEPVRDHWNEAGFAQYEELYPRLVEAGITPHFSISSAPAWARDQRFAPTCNNSSKRCVFPPARSMLPEWREFVVEITRRFPRATIEVWNEPNFAANWRPGVKRYTELLAVAYRAVKARNPRTQVLMGGLGSTIKPGSRGIGGFLERAYSASPSLKGHTDAINVHVYPGSDMGPGSLMARVFDAVRTTRKEHRDVRTPIYVTEVGATTTGPRALSERAQADVVTRATLRLLTMRDVEGVFVHRLFEPLEVPPADRERGFGLLRPSLIGSSAQPKTAYCAVARALGEMQQSC